MEDIKLHYKLECSPKAFLSFLKENRLLIVVCLLVGLLMYGIELFNFTIGFDTVIHLTELRYINWLEYGRFGMILLQTVLSPHFFNPYTSIFLGFLLLVGGSLLYPYMLHVFSRGRIPSSLYLAFSLLYLTGAVWAEHFYYVLQTAEIMLATAFVPITSYCLYDGLLSKKPSRFILGILGNAFLLSIYQSILSLYFCHIFASFVVLREFLSDGESPWENERKGLSFCIKLIVAMLASFVIYTLFSKLILFATHTQNTAKLNIKTVFSSLVKVLYFIFPDDCDFITQKIDPLVASHAVFGMETVRGLKDDVAGITRQGYFTYLLFLVAVSMAYLVAVFLRKDKKVLTTLSAVCVPLCLLIFPILHSVPFRANYVCTFALSFMSLYILFHLQDNHFKFLYKLFYAFIIVVCFYQASRNSDLMYSFYKQNQADMMSAQKIDFVLQDFICKNNLPTDTPVVIVGAPDKYSYAKDKPRQEMIGWGFFSDNTLFRTQARGDVRYWQQAGCFMEELGFHYNFSSDIATIQKAYDSAKNLPDFPSEGSVSLVDGCIILKLASLEGSSFELQRQLKTFDIGL